MIMGSDEGENDCYWNKPSGKAPPREEDFVAEFVGEEGEEEEGEKKVKSYLKIF